MKSYSFNSDVYTIEGAVSIEDNENYTVPWRIDFQRRKLFPFMDTFGQGDACPCVRLSFSTNSQNIGIDIYETFYGTDGIHDVMMLDLVSDGDVAQTVRLDKGEGIYYFDELEAGMKEIEIWLDAKFPVRFKSIYIDDSAVIRKTQSSKKRLVCYGSSITHSVRAKSPYYTWPGIAAREKDMHITNLGFGGNCILDPMMGYVMRDMEADLFCLELGANCYGGNLTERSFGPCAIGLIETIRQKHKKAPIVIMSPILFSRGETLKGGCGMSIPEMRDVLRQTVESYKSYGDENIYYVSGLDVFGKEDAVYMDDNIHPNAQGQFVMARKFVDKVLDKILSGDV